MSAGAEPVIFFARRLAAQRAADARTRWFPVAVKLVIRNNHRDVGDRTHARYYDLHSFGRDVGTRSVKLQL